jgi:hypothetical protein
MKPEQFSVPAFLFAGAAGGESCKSGIREYDYARAHGTIDFI